ncbi:unnamed protein product, partial [Schistocephalus solidus]|uniref:ABC transporter domain-containing protein n=1 Tax=Schistocephalus solidus TaxID=70667 RepID=A0A183TIQ3_SCHSO
MLGRLHLLDRAGNWRPHLCHDFIAKSRLVVLGDSADAGNGPQSSNAGPEPVSLGSHPATATTGVLSIMIGHNEGQMAVQFGSDQQPAFHSTLTNRRSEPSSEIGLETMSNSQEKEENKSVELTQPLCLRKISFCQHYRLLLWKSFLLRSRQPIFLVFELFLPLILIFVLVGMRYAQERAIYPPCHITSQPLPSMGFFTHLRSLICSANLTCTAYDYDRPPGAMFDLPPWLIGLASVGQSDSSDFLKPPIGPQPLPVAAVRKTLDQFTVGSNESALTASLDLIDTLGCDEKTFSLLGGTTSGPRVTTLARTYCLLPRISRKLLHSVLEGHLYASDVSPFAVADHLMRTADILASVRSSSTPNYQTPNMTVLLEAIKRISIPVCGSRPGQNDFLALAD